MTQKAFKYRFYPTPEQETLLRRTMQQFSLWKIMENYGNNARSREARSLILSFSNVDKKAILMPIYSTYTLK